LAFNVRFKIVLDMHVSFMAGGSLVVF